MIVCFPLITSVWVLGRIVDLICGRFLLWPLGIRFLFVLLLTSLPLDDRDVWLAFGLAVVLPLWVCRFATFDPSVVLRHPGGGCESSRERSFIVSSYTP